MTNNVIRTALAAVAASAVRERLVPLMVSPRAVRGPSLAITNVSRQDLSRAFSFLLVSFLRINFREPNSDLLFLWRENTERVADRTRSKRKGRENKDVIER